MADWALSENVWYHRENKSTSEYSGSGDRNLAIVLYQEQDSHGGKHTYSCYRMCLSIPNRIGFGIHRALNAWFCSLVMRPLFFYFVWTNKWLRVMKILWFYQLPINITRLHFSNPHGYQFPLYQRCTSPTSTILLYKYNCYGENCRCGYR